MCSSSFATAQLPATRDDPRSTAAASRQAVSQSVSEMTRKLSSVIVGESTYADTLIHSSAAGRYECGMVRAATSLPHTTKRAHRSREEGLSLLFIHYDMPTYDPDDYEARIEVGGPRKQPMERPSTRQAEDGRASAMALSTAS
eukprot:GHVU01032735.1.p1 GENE.GHVU01032735.1~~GHVU01032735.1.p1  ORF type:complete len:143 (-),score=9.62 GHVU01032735.1:151-579(-)